MTSSVLSNRPYVLQKSLSCKSSEAVRGRKVLQRRTRSRAQRSCMPTQALFSFFSKTADKTSIKTTEQKQLGPLKVSPMGLGTWSWGNQLLWGYDKSMDPELQQLFNLVVSKGVNIFDTADSYGA